jgi:hypothetical protein
MPAHVGKLRPAGLDFLSILNRTHGRRAGISTPGMPLCAHIWPAGGVSLARERAGKKPIRLTSDKRTGAECRSGGGALA